MERNMMMDYVFFVPTALLIVSSFLMASMFLLASQKKRRLIKENEYLEISSRLMEEHYSILSRQIKQTTRYQEEIQNQFDKISGIKEEQVNLEKLLEFRQSLLEFSQELNKLDYCKDAVLNAVFYNKIEECRENKILVNLQLNNFSSGNIDDLTKIMLFYWIFSFYERVALELLESLEKRISITCENYAGYLVVLCSGSYVKKGQSWFYKKPSTPEIKNLQKLVQKYDGAIEAREEEDCLVLALSLRTK